jgi:regulator of replication initiation timing
MELASAVQADPSDRLNPGGQNFDEAARDRMRDDMRDKEIEHLRSVINEIEEQRAGEIEHLKSIISDLQQQQVRSRKELHSQFVENTTLGQENAVLKERFRSLARKQTPVQQYSPSHQFPASEALNPAATAFRQESFNGMRPEL